MSGPFYRTKFQEEISAPNRLDSCFICVLVAECMTGRKSRQKWRFLWAWLYKHALLLQKATPSMTKVKNLVGMPREICGAFAFSKWYKCAVELQHLIISLSGCFCSAQVGKLCHKWLSRQADRWWFKPFFQSPDVGSKLERNDRKLGTCIVDRVWERENRLNQLCGETAITRSACMKFHPKL